MVDTLKIWENTRKISRALLFGSFALLLLLTYFAPILALAFTLYVKTKAFLELILNTSFDGIQDMSWGLVLFIILLFIATWALHKIPMVGVFVRCVRMVFSSVTDMAAKIWDLRQLPESAVRVEIEVEVEFDEDDMEEVEAFLKGEDEDFEARLAAETEAELEAEEMDVDVRHFHK